MKLFATILLLIVIQFSAYSQFRSEDEYETFDFLYTREYIYGINFNTNGGLIGGLMFKHTRVITHGMYHSFSIEAVNVKHPKERRVTSFLSGNSFIPGKINYLYVLRPQYGRDIILFQKAKRQGVQVNWNNSIGPTIGLEAPYLIDYRYSNSSIRTEQFDPDRHTLESIVGVGNFFRSLSQANIVPGGSFKSSLVFEFSNIKNSVTGFEAGFMLDAFTREVELMPNTANRSIYTSAFITLFYGARK